MNKLYLSWSFCYLNALQQIVCVPESEWVIDLKNEDWNVPYSHCNASESWAKLYKKYIYFLLVFFLLPWYVYCTFNITDIIVHQNTIVIVMVKSVTIQ